VPHQKSTAVSTDQQQQTQDQPASHKFEFINTTTDIQYSGPGSRSIARSHVMRNFHRKKGKSRLHQSNLQGPGTSQSLLATAQVRGQSNPNRGPSRFTDVDNTWLHKLDENAMHYMIHSENKDDTGNKSGLLLGVLRHQGRSEGHHELQMSSLWALPVDAHAVELIHHCKPFLFQICSGHCLCIHSLIYYRMPSISRNLITYHPLKTFRSSPRLSFL